jgi:hypothetical protein
MESFKMEIFTFSDTLILFLSGGNIKNLLDSISIYLSFLIVAAVDRNIYLRGAMSYGNFYSSTEHPIFIGPAIDEVAEWYEKSQVIGVISTPSVTFLLEKIRKEKMDLLLTRYKFLKYNIPMKTNLSYNGWMHNWTIAISSYLENNTFQQNIKPNNNNIKSNSQDKNPQKEELIGKIKEHFKGYKQELENNRGWLLEKFSKTSIGIYDYTKFKNTLDFYNFVIKVYSNVST